MFQVTDISGSRANGPLDPLFLRRRVEGRFHHFVRKLRAIPGDHRFVPLMFEPPQMKHPDPRRLFEDRSFGEQPLDFPDDPLQMGRREAMFGRDFRRGTPLHGDRPENRPIAFAG